MSSKETEQSLYEEHQAAWENLPWYVNGTLEASELELVESHVANCVACRSEIKYMRQLAGLMKGAEQPLPSGSSALSAVSERIERLERDEVPKSPTTPAGKLRRLVSSQLHQPRVLWRLLAVQAAMILMLLSSTVWLGRMAPPETYRTLSDAVSEGSERGVRIRLVFADGVSERQLRELLRFVDGEIVAGPSAMGVYTVRLAPPSHEESELAALLEELRASPQVQFAELAGATASNSTEKSTNRR